MFDIHCHIAFGCDDGAQTIEEAIDMIELASVRGTRGIVATPHCGVIDGYENYWGNDILNKIKALRQSLAERYIDVKIFCGQEIFFTPQTFQLLKEGKLITLNNSKYPLVEFDFYEYADSVYKKLHHLVAEGYVPIVAHPERYAFMAEDESAPLRVKSMGCLLQVNKSSLNGKFGDDAYFVAKRILDCQLADVIASDAHSPYVRTPNMLDAYEYVAETYSYDYADLLFEENPKRIIQNKKTYTL